MRIKWDQSSLGQLMTCPYKYQLSNIEGYYKPGKVENLNRTWGHAVHACGDEYDAVIFQGGRVDDALHAAIKEAWNWKDRLTPSPNQAADWDKSRTYETLIRALIWYSEEYKEAPLTLAQLPDGTPATEIRFEVPLGPYRISGRLDKLISFNDILYILDRKTTGKGLTDYYFKFYEPDNQVLAYHYACSEQLGMPIAGFMVDAWQALVGGNRFRRHTIAVTPGQIEFWKRSVITAIDEANRYEEQGFFPQRYSGCNQYGGCVFRDVCKRDPAFHSDWLKSDYEKREEKQ